MDAGKAATRPKRRLWGALTGVLCLFAGLWILRLSGGAPLRLGMGLMVAMVGLDALLGALRGRRSLLLRLGP